MEALESTPAEEIARIFELQKAAFGASGIPPLERRLQNLRKLRLALRRRAPEIERAVSADFGKAPAEIALTEVLVVASEVEHAIRNLARWMRPVRIGGGLTFPGARAEVRREPKGVCLVLAPGNYPFQLAVGPVVSALAAGNRVILKPSELTPHTSAFLRRFLEEIFAPDEVAVVEGDARTGASLLEMPFDHIFFTGSTAVGRIVLAAAARHLASVTLELGGKCPVLLDETADLREAASKIAWGKFVNAGQACVAPDYVLVPQGRVGEFADRLRESLRRLYGPPEGRAENSDYCRLIDRRHFERARRLLEEAVRAGARVVEGGVFVEEENFLSPTVVVTEAGHSSALLREEIFAPILPLVPYASEAEAVAHVNSLPVPLALYLFSRRREWVERCLASIPSGDAVVNDVVVHFANFRLPFGGHRSSGVGKSHGEAGFRAFSHERAIMRQPRFTVMGLLFPPYTEAVRRRIALVYRFFAGR
jgi:aldehyde dehydrogenase (NAD+)